MKVGFLGFGEVASIISKGLMDGGAEVYTSLEGRSDRSRNLAGQSGVNICKDQLRVAEISDIIISAVVPAAAIEVAQRVGKKSNGIYVDINNVSPQTVKKALNYIANGKTADAAIMGSIKKKGIKVQIIVSGDYANQFTKLNNYGMNIKVIGPNIGQASTLKMLRSSYTKGVSALLFESLNSAYKMGLDEKLLICLEETECPGFRESAISRIISSAFHAERRAQEMDEVLQMTAEHSNPLMIKSAAEFYRKLSQISKAKKRQQDYKDVFKKINMD